MVPRVWKLSFEVGRPKLSDALFDVGNNDQPTCNLERYGPRADRVT